MVWYVPPLSPVMGMIEGEGSEADPDDVFPAIDELRIPVAYLANLLTAGDEEPVRLALKRLAAMRAFMREQTLGGEPDPAVAARCGLEPADGRAAVPAARDREVRRALRHPEGARRGRRATWASARAPAASPARPADASRRG